MNKFKLYHGDCLEVMKDIPDGSVDAIICDPPYGTTACKWDSIIPLDKMWKQLKRVIRPSGAIVLFGQEPFSSILRCSNLEMFKYDWIWEKSNATGFLNSKKRPLSAFEVISVFYEKQCTYNPIMSHGHVRKVSSAKNRKDAAERFNSRDRQYGLQNLDTIKDYDSTSRYPRSVLKFARDTQKNHLHPTQKPINLMEYLVKTYTDENETVLDFTLGSGTTGVACANTNRNFIGIEMDEKYFNIAKERIETAYKQQGE